MSSKLTNIVKSLEQQESNERVSSYQLLEKLIQKSTSSIDVTDQTCKILASCIITDLKSPIKECLSSILFIVEYFVKQDKKKKLKFPPDVYQDNELLANLVDILGNIEFKEHVEKIYFIFIEQEFDIEILELFVESLLTSCVVSGTSTDLTLVKVIKRFLEQCSKEMHDHINLWFILILKMTSHNNLKVRESACNVITDNIKFLVQNRSKILSKCSKTLRQTIFPALQSMIDKTIVLEEVLTIQIPLFLALIGEEFKRSSSFTNLHLSFIQKGFVSKNESIQINAFGAWGYFINAFAENREILSSTRYIKLLIQPLTIKLKTVPLTKTCIQTMWMLSVYLNEKIVELYDEVCLPLLRLSFSCLASPSSRRLSQRLSANELSKSTIKDPVIHLLGAELLAHMLCDTTSMKFKFRLPALESPYFGTPSSFSRYQSSIVPALTTVFVHPTTNISNEFLFELWKVFLTCTQDHINRKRDTDLFKALFQLANQIVTTTNYSPEFLLKLISSLTRFPTKILNSSLNFSPGSFNGTPALSLLQLLFHKTIYNDTKDTNEFFDCLKTVISCGMESKLATLDFAYSVVKLLGNDNIVDLKIWLCLATLLGDYITKTSYINQGDSLDHDFTSVYSTLLFPIQFLISYNLNIDKLTLKNVTSSWTELLKNFSFLSSEIETTKHEEAKMTICNQICEKLNDHQTKNITTTNCVQFFESVVLILIENVEFKELERRKSNKRRSIDLIEVNEDLNGFNSAITQLISCLHKVRIDGEKYKINLIAAITDIFFNLPQALVQGFFLDLLFVISDLLQSTSNLKNLTTEKQVTDCWSVILERLSFSQELFEDDNICELFKIALSSKSTKIYSSTVNFWEFKVILETESLTDDFVEVLDMMYKKEGFKIPWEKEQNVSLEENMYLNVSCSTTKSEQSNFSELEESEIMETSETEDAAISAENENNKIIIIDDSVTDDIIDKEMNVEENNIVTKDIKSDDQKNKNNNVIMSKEEDDDVIMSEEEDNDVIFKEEESDDVISEETDDDVTQFTTPKTNNKKLKKQKEIIVLDSEESDSEESDSGKRKSVEKVPTRLSRRQSARISARLSSVEFCKKVTLKKVAKQQKTEDSVYEDLKKLSKSQPQKSNTKGVSKSMKQKDDDKITEKRKIKTINLDDTGENPSDHETSDEQDSCDLTNDSNYVETEEEENSDDDNFISADDASLVTDCDVTKNDDPDEITVDDSVVEETDFNESETSLNINDSVAEKSVYEVVEMANMSILPTSQPNSDQESENEVNKSAVESDNEVDKSIIDGEKSIYEVVEMANMSILPTSQPSSDQESENEIDKSAAESENEVDKSVVDQEKSVYEVMEMANMSILPTSQPNSDQESENEVNKSAVESDNEVDKSIIDGEKSIYEVVEMANMSILPTSQPSSDQESENEIDKSAAESENEVDKSVVDQEKSIIDGEKSIYEVVEMANMSILPSTLMDINESDSNDLDSDQENEKPLKKKEDVDVTIKHDNLKSDVTAKASDKEKLTKNKSKTTVKQSRQNKAQELKTKDSLNRTFEEECAEELGVQPLDESFEVEPVLDKRQTQKQKQAQIIEDDPILQKVDAVVNDDVIGASQESNSSKTTPLRKSLRKRAPTPKALDRFSYGKSSKTRKPKSLNMIPDTDETNKETKKQSVDNPDLRCVNDKSDSVVKETEKLTPITEKIDVKKDIPINFDKSEEATATKKHEEKSSEVNVEEKSPESVEKNKENLNVDLSPILPLQNDSSTLSSDTKKLPSVLISSQLNAREGDQKGTPKSVNRLMTIREECSVISSPGILKRRISEVLSPSTNKSRRVSFAEPISISSTNKNDNVIETSPNTSQIDWQKRKSPHRVVSRRLSLPISKRSVGGARPDVTCSPLSVRSVKIAAAIADIKARSGDLNKPTTSTLSNKINESPSKLSMSTIPELSMLRNLSDDKYLQSFSLENLGQIAESLFRFQHCVHKAIMKKSTG